MSGNAVKLMQPHNAFGSLDVEGLVLEMGDYVRRKAGLFPGPETYQACQFSLPRFHRLDITRSYRHASVQEKQEYIRYVAGSAKSRHGAAKLFGSETAYFGMRSRRWSFKVYDKLAELLKHTPDGQKGWGSADMGDIRAWSECVSRFELCLRGPELETLTGYDLYSQEDLRSLWKAYYDKIQFNENAAMDKTQEIDTYGLPGRLVAVMALWRSGKDIRSVFPKNTFYRYRRQILAASGVDIAMPPQDVDAGGPVKAKLDPAGWDPEPIQRLLIEPREHLKGAYAIKKARALAGQ